jgi:hypothetical protein
MDRICYWDEAAQAQAERDATPEEQAEIDARRAAPLPVPAKVTRRQALSALRIKNISAAAIEVAIMALPTSQLNIDLALIDFRESLEFEYTRPLVIQLCTAMGLDRDDLFRLAGSL